MIFKIFLFSCFMVSSLSAQKLTMGSEKLEPFDCEITQFIHADETGFVVRRYLRTDGSRRSDALERIDNNLSSAGTIKIPSELNGKYVSIINVYGGNNLFVTGTHTPSKEKRLALVCMALDPVTLTPESSFREVCSIPFSKYGNFSAWQTFISPNGSKLLAKIMLESGNKQPETMFLHVSNTPDMGVLWKKEFVLPCMLELFEVQDVLVADNGNVFVAVKLYSENARDKRNNKPNYSYIVYCFSPAGESPVQFQINLPDFFISDFTFRMNDDGNLVGVGLYSEKSAMGMKGVFHFVLDGSGQVVKNLHSEEFRSDQFEGNLSETAINFRKEPEGFQIKKLFFREDGRVVMVAEKEMTQYWQGDSKLVQRTDFYVDDVILADISSEGSVNWVVRLRKKALLHTNNVEYGSIVCALQKDSVIVVFNDNPANRERTLNDAPEIFLGYAGETICVVISPEGKVNKTAVLNSKEEGILIQPEICNQIKPDSPLLLYGNLGRQYKFAWLSL